MVEWFVKAVPENPTSRRKLIVAASAGVLAVAVIGALWSNSTSGSGEVEVSETPASTIGVSSGTMFVQVVGAVTSPGVYEVPFDSRVMDVIELAGGMTEQADPASLNLARIVQDGEQLIIGERGRTANRGVVGQSALVNINSATAADFETLPRIGATLAERIVAFRDTNGPFVSVESLLDVPGIGELTLAGMREKLTL